MPQRIDLGRALLVLGAVLLIIALFLEWYDSGPTGWEVFEALDVILAGLAGAAIAVAARAEKVPAAAAWGLPVAVVFVTVVQLIDGPPAAGEADPATGAWLALGAGLVMAAGGALSLAAISVTVQVRERELRRRVPAVDRREDATAAPEDADPEPRGSVLHESPPVSDPDRTQPLSAVPDEEEGPDPRPGSDRS